MSYLRNHDRHDDTTDLLAVGLFLCRNDKSCALAVEELHYNLSTRHVREDLDDEWRLESDCKGLAIVLTLDLLICCNRETEILCGNFK